ncbi:GerAB/ArcD/ProY family transporter [Sporohalobacter salinus]|uniref:GerAB/ArcD/ProY family transporter n=1 Tax=Sporohalobacter salinus TaxID=1494606 RepID=UPI00195FD383|nr:endospore germination permease [Sporohalobacter salinus]MBM7624227.1 spore germination protein (amino acid permease) [Sporohalobacter salinus]
MRIDEIKKYQLSSNQLMFIIIQVCVGIGILSLPRAISSTSKQSSWLSIIIGGLMWVAAVFIMYKLGSLFPKDTIIEYSPKILGKFLGSIIGISYFAYSTFAAAIIARLFITVLTRYILPQTPVLVTIIILILTCLYSSSLGFKTMARLHQFLFFALVPTFLLLIPASFKIDLLNLQPVFNTGIKSILKGSYDTMSSYLGIEIILLIFPFVKQKKKAFKYSVIGIVTVMLTYLYIVIINIGFFGSDTLQHMIWPTINILKAIRIPFFGRLEFLFIFFWIAIVFTTVQAYCHRASYSLTQLFNWEDHRLSNFILFPIIISLASIPDDIWEAFNYINLVDHLGTILAFVIPSSMLLIAKLRGVKGNQ